jgi:hypothetical protein
MTADQEGYDRQKAFDDALLNLGLFDFADYGPPADAFEATLNAAGYVIHGFEIRKSAYSRGNLVHDRKKAMSYGSDNSII